MCKQTPAGFDDWPITHISDDSHRGSQRKTNPMGEVCASLRDFPSISSFWKAMGDYSPHQLWAPYVHTCMPIHTCEQTLIYHKTYTYEIGKQKSHMLIYNV